VTQLVVLGAQQLADREGHPEVQPEHLLVTLVEQREGIVPEIVRKMNADPAALASAIRKALPMLPTDMPGQPESREFVSPHQAPAPQI